MLVLGIDMYQQAQDLLGPKSVQRVGQPCTHRSMRWDMPSVSMPLTLLVL